MESKKIKGVEHYVFESIKEFENYFMHKDGAVPELVKDWRKGKEGNWVLADDGGVVQILRQKPLPHPHDRKVYKNNGNGWCRTVVGTFVQNEKFDMDTDFSLHPNRYRFGGTSNKDVKEHTRNREKPTKREKIFSIAIATGKSLQMAYEEAYGPKTNWREKALDLVKRETVMKEVRKNSVEVLRDLGIDLRRIYSGLLELAEESEDDSVRFRSWKELREALEPKESRRMSLTGRETYGFSGFANEDLKQIEAEEVMALAEGETIDELPKVREIDGVED